MKQNKKLSLNELKVKSFVTEVKENNTIKGGADLTETIDVMMCTRLSCGIVACDTRYILNCL